MLLIQNAHLIDPASRTDGIRDILIEGEKIIKIAEHIAPEEAAGCGPETAGAAAADEKTKDASGKTQAAPALTVLNAEGLTAIPGLVDAHVHFRDPGFTWKEDIDSGARAAAAGGVTTVVLMANTKPCVDNADTLRYVLEEGRKDAHPCGDLRQRDPGNEGEGAGGHEGASRGGSGGLYGRRNPASGGGDREGGHGGCGGGGRAHQLS